MSGRLVLASKGTQDLWISEEPTYTHFLFAMKKHTKFAFDTQEFPLLEAKFDQETICYIPMDVGDLLTRITLRYTIDHTTSSSEYIFTNFAGVHAIDYVDLFMGGVKIQRLTGDWIYLYNKITNDRSTFDNTLDNLMNINGTNPMYIDIPFYFHDNLKTSILCCKLQKHNCYLKIKFKKWEDIVHTRFQNTVSNISITKASVLARYCYLDHGELQYLKSNPIDQVITQLQLRRFDISRGETKKVRLNFKNPVKTLYFYVYNKTRTLRFYTSQLYDIDPPIPDGWPYDTTGEYYMMNMRFSRAKLLFNNRAVFNEDYTTSVHKNSIDNSISGHKTFIPSASFDTLYSQANRKVEKPEIGSYSFAMYPLKDEPSGHVNFSRIIHQEFELEIPSSELYTYAAFDTGATFTNDFVGNDNECKIYAVSYNVLTYNSGLCGLRF